MVIIELILVKEKVKTLERMLDKERNKLNLGDTVKRIAGSYEGMNIGDESIIIEFDHGNHVKLKDFRDWHANYNLVKVFPEQPNNLILIL